MSRVLNVAALWLLWMVQGIAAQAPASRAGRRVLLPREMEVALARSAAPASVSARARVLIFTDSGYVEAERGSSAVTCIVSRSWSTSIEPQCFDAEASVTILPAEMRRIELYHIGQSYEAVEREIANGFGSGTFRPPHRPAMTWMMSEGQQLVGDDGKAVGKWRPHVMIYYPWLSNADLGLAPTPDFGAGMVSEEGKPTSNLMIVMPTFVAVSAVSR